jgi:hypothetical protein
MWIIRSATYGGYNNSTMRASSLNMTCTKASFCKRYRNHHYNHYHRQPQQHLVQSRSYTTTDTHRNQTVVTKTASKYVWNEPPGRMKHILDIIRMSEKRFQNLNGRTLPKLQEMFRRVRISNSSAVTRVHLIQSSYEDCRDRLRQIKEKVTLLCQRYKIDTKSIPKRRKFKFHKSKHNNHHDSISDNDDSNIDDKYSAIETPTTTNTLDTTTFSLSSTASSTSITKKANNNIPTHNEIAIKYERKSTTAVNNPILTDLLHFK